MDNIFNKTVREIAIEYPAATRVFEEAQIDYCCGGKIPFAEACAARGVDQNAIRQKIETAVAAGPVSPAGFPEQMSTSQLISHIIDRHHTFTRVEIARLAPLMSKVCRKHGNLHPELFQIAENFDKLAGELLPHMGKEERVLFPYINGLDAAIAADESIVTPHFGTVQNPIRTMMFEHEAAGEILELIRKLSSDYKVPEGACPSYIALYAGLEDLERDLHRHIHLENNVLFLRAVEAENRLARFATALF